MKRKRVISTSDQSDAKKRKVNLNPSLIARFNDDNDESNNNKRPYSFIVLQSDSKEHPGNGSIGQRTNLSLENYMRVEELYTYFRWRFPTQVATMKHSGSCLSTIIENLGKYPNASLLDFLSPHAQNTQKRIALNNNRDLILNNEIDENHDTIMLDENISKSVAVALRATSQHLKSLEILMHPKSTTKRIFSIARPPGHHACHREGAGFCLINHVGVLIVSDFLKDKNILIIDFDIHQGDGTQKMIASMKEIFKDRLQFISVHARHKNIYPYSFYEPDHDCKCFLNNIEIGGKEHFDLTTVSQKIKARIKNIGKSRNNWRPDILIFSAGFDGHKEDNFGGKFESQDYGLLTEHILNQLKNTYEDLNIEQLPILAILEGGYNIEALKKSGEAMFNVLSKKK